MPSFVTTLSERFSSALTSAFGTSYDVDPELRPAKPEFGHFQTGVAMRLAGRLKLPPATVAERLADALELAGVATVTVSRPGFVNVRLLPATLAAGVDAVLAGPGSRPGLGRVVVDYSAPNVAKQLLVHHLRSTVIGDALCRVLDRAGYDVIRQNHLGDWGTQFGMLIEHLRGTAGELGLAELEDAYRQARQRFDTEPGFAAAVRARLVGLQSGDPDTRAEWRRIVELSLTEFEAVYRRLGVLLTPADIAAESSYNDALPAVVDDLAAAGLLTESDGALCAFPPGFTGRDGLPLPLIVRKGGGAFGYAATDLAALRYRVDELAADRIVVLTDNRQSLHFAQVFAVARQAGWLPDRVRAEHAPFGTMLGADGRPFKTRDGGSATLVSLLDEAETRAAELLAGRDSDLPAGTRAEVVRAVGIGAVKYADLVNDRTRDYAFAPERMTALDGNTGPYLQYAHARVSSILRKAGDPLPAPVTVLENPAEQRLALLLGGFDDVVAEVAETLQPHRLCGYLYDVAVALSRFYADCPVLTSDGEVRASRLALCAATRTVLADGLGLLGIEAPATM